jgi:FkbM family methyltransferase
MVFDVGANRGEWTCLAMEHMRLADIHAFEPVPQTAALLRSAVGIGVRAEVHECALGDSDGTRRISLNVPRSELVSLLDLAEGPDSIVVAVRRGDAICSELGIERIDLLKIDAEGSDHQVIAGFDTMLRRSLIDVVQFEYGAWAFTTKFLLRDFWNAFEGHRYVVGKLHPRGVAFGPYSTRLEDFRGLNFVAVTTDRPDLIAELRER